MRHTAEDIMKDLMKSMPQYYNLQQDNLLNSTKDLCVTKI